MQYADLRRLLYETALYYGASVRFSARAIDADPIVARIVLESGECLNCDVIVGADGTCGLTRKMMLSVDFEGKKKLQLMKMYR